MNLVFLNSLVFIIVPLVILIDLLIIFNIIKIQKSINHINKKTRLLLKKITKNTTVVQKLKKKTKNVFIEFNTTEEIDE